jgi:hypothetical protein
MRARWPPAPESGDILGAYAAVFELEDEDGAVDQDDHVIHAEEIVQAAMPSTRGQTVLFVRGGAGGQEGSRIAAATSVIGCFSSNGRRGMVPNVISSRVAGAVPNVARGYNYVFQ